MVHKRVWQKLVSLGIDRAPKGEQTRVRRMNERVVTDVLTSMTLNMVYVVFGAWQMLGLSIALSVVGPIVLLCNYLGYRFTARFLLSLSFAICIAVVNVTIGSWTHAEVLFFAGVGSMYANFRDKEKIGIASSFVLSAALVGGSHFWALTHEPMIAINVIWKPWIIMIAWSAGTIFLISQIQVFVQTVRRSQERLRESEELHSAIFNQAATGLNILSADGRFLKSNPEMCRILGMTEEEILGKRTVELTAPDDVDRSHADFAMLQRREIDVLTKQKKYIHKSGRFIPANLQTRALYHPSGELRYLISSVQDLTDAKLAEQKLVQASKMSSLGEMAGSIAHEINTPLATMLLSAERLEDEELRSKLSPAQVTAIAETISSTVLRVAKIVRGLKAFARNADQDPMEEVRVTEVVADSLELCKEKFKSHGIEIVTSLDPDIRLHCRPTQISQVLVNLLSNAIDAVESSKPKQRWVRVEAAASATHVVLHIIDSGLGIAPAIAERILEPFFTTKPVGAGTGLGLSVSKGIIESHGGRFFLDRAREHTCFVLEMPVRVSELAAA